MTTIRPTQGAIGDETSLPLPRLLGDSCTITLPANPRGQVRAPVRIGVAGVPDVNGARVVVVAASVDALTVTF